MDLTIEHRLSELEGKRKWRKVYFAFAAPGYVLCLFYTFVCILAGIQLAEAWPFPITIAVLFSIGLLRNWPRTWRMYRELFRRQGAFEHPTVIHLTDNFIETSCGENHSKYEYSLYTHYFCMKEYIALLHKRTLVNVFDRKDFSDGGKEWMACLEASGVKKKCFWDFRRWWLALFFLLAVVFMLTIPCHANSANSEWGREKAARTACVSYLKMTGLGLMLYADDNDLHYPPNLKTLVDKEYLVKMHCPGTGYEYRYVHYPKLSNENAANKPIVIEDIGSHWKKKGLFGKRIFLTSILFADAHVMTLENLCDYMDIYEQYGKFLSEEEAQVLKECCEKWDNECDNSTQPCDSQD